MFDQDYNFYLISLIILITSLQDNFMDIIERSYILITYPKTHVTFPPYKLIKFLSLRKKQVSISYAEPLGVESLYF